MKKQFDFNKIILSPYFASAFVLVSLFLYYIVCFIFSLKFGCFDIEEIGVTETLTYLFYGFASGVAICFIKDYLNTKEQNTYFAINFLFITALFREMGIQHWLTSHDTAITKTRFFLNPNNPLYEKIIAGILMLIVMSVSLWVIVKYFKKIVLGLIKFKTIPWTTFTFSILVIITQFADRFPANYMKTTGVELTEYIKFILKILEEGGESLLPLLFAIGILQYHLILKKKFIK